MRGHHNVQWAFCRIDFAVVGAKTDTFQSLMIMGEQNSVVSHIMRCSCLHKCSISERGLIESKDGRNPFQQKLHSASFDKQMQTDLS